FLRSVQRTPCARNACMDRCTRARRRAPGSASSLAVVHWTARRETPMTSSRSRHPRAARRDELDNVPNALPDARDGLTRKERIVLYVLHETQKERGDRPVP